jgi:NitT/TauT family transport system ATP-binding protein
MSHIHIDRLFKTYPGNPPVRALENVQLDIAPGEFVALLGPSGCGKSTLLNAVASFEKISSGTLTVGGKFNEAPGPDRGVVFQEAALFPWLTVWENIIFGPKAQGLSPADYEDHALEMLGIMGLSDFKDHLPIQLSGGMRQRVGIARVLTLGSKILLMDEPFGALDAMTRQTLQDEVARLAVEQKTTVVFITHDLEEAIYLGDRVVALSANPGRIVEMVEVGIPRPRNQLDTREDSRFLAHRHHLFGLLQGH